MKKKTDKETKAKRKQIQMIIKAKSPDVHKHLRKNMQLIWKKNLLNQLKAVHSAFSEDKIIYKTNMWID